MNDYKELSAITAKRISYYIRVKNGKADLKVGQEYSALGIIFRENVPWVYVISDDGYCPYPQPIDYFEVSNPKIPGDWVLATRILPDGRVESQLLPKMWAQEDRFYERLLDEDPDIEEKMRKLLAAIE